MAFVHKHKRPITRLWRISVGWAGKYPVIYVRKGPLRGSCGNKCMIRACTGKAAGRKAARFLPHQMAGADYETDNPMGSTYMDLTPEMVKRYQKYRHLARIKVVKESPGSAAGAAGGQREY